MAISSTDVLRAFIIQSGSTNLLNGTLNINYVKFNNQTTDVPVSLINTATDFHIKAYPSSTMFAVYKIGSAEQVTQNNPIVIGPASSRDAIIRVVTDLNNEPEQTQPQSITFTLSAMVSGSSSSQSSSSSSSSTTSGATAGEGGGGGGGGGDTQPDPTRQTNTGTQL